MSPDSLADVHGEVLVGVLEAARARRLDPERPLFPWLCKIAHARAVDLFRRRTAYGRVLSAVVERLRETGTGRRWSALDEARRVEIGEAIRDAVVRLSMRQRLVFQLWANPFPETAKLQVPRRLVSDATGREETLGAVKRALEEGRGKVRRFLKEKGHGDLEGGDG